MEPIYWWLIAMVVFLLLEAATISMVSLWFAVGALAAVIVSFFAGPVWQVAAFLVVSVVLLSLFRPVARKRFLPKLVRTNVDDMVGKEGYVTDAIDNTAARGTVKLGAMDWTARSTSGENIAAGSLVRVDRIEGVKVLVSLVQQPAKVNP